MLYEIEQAVFERFPGYARMVVVAEDVYKRQVPLLTFLKFGRGDAHVVPSCFFANTCCAKLTPTSGNHDSMWA